jgi:hypothetical protein
LAFDTANGRFWVICPKCKRWNLSPFEERWDAMDECERLFEGTRLRMSTDNIGLGRIADGTELVRVGAALRPEMAAWRYASTLTARYKRSAIVGVGTVGLAVGWFSGAWLIGGTLVAASLGADAMLWGGRGVYERIRGVPVAEPESGDLIHLSLSQLRDARFNLEDDTPMIRVPNGLRPLYYRGTDVPRVLPTLLAGRNWKGAPRKGVDHAVRMLAEIESESGPAALSDALYRKLVHWRTSMTGPDGYQHGYLALEMALQEQRERELLAGELLDLEIAWRDAEELARIADTLVPSYIEQALTALKRRVSRGGLDASQRRDR